MPSKAKAKVKRTRRKKVYKNCPFCLSSKVTIDVCKHVGSYKRCDSCAACWISKVVQKKRKKGCSVRPSQVCEPPLPGGSDGVPLSVSTGREVTNVVGKGNAYGDSCSGCDSNLCKRCDEFVHRPDPGIGTQSPGLVMLITQVDDILIG